MQTAAATHAVALAMQSASGVMQSVNKTADPISMQQTMAAFSRESEIMDLAGVMMDDALEGNESEDEADDVVNQVTLSQTRKQPSVLVYSCHLVISAGKH